MASAAFFPFADGLITACEAGAIAVIQPGGSIRDDEVIEAANDRDIAMVFTGMRHFRHQAGTVMASALTYRICGGDNAPVDSCNFNSTAGVRHLLS